MQFKWETEYGDVYSCSDIIINWDFIGQYLGKFLNDGNCFNGKCLYAKGFSGDFCENKKGSSNAFKYLWILTLIDVLSGLGYLLVSNFDKIKNLFNDLLRKWKDVKNIFNKNNNSEEFRSWNWNEKRI